MAREGVQNSSVPGRDSAAVVQSAVSSGELISSQKDSQRREQVWNLRVALLLPGLLGTALYLLNNLDVIHGLIAPPHGYALLGVQRNFDIAQYLTWIRGLEKGWLLPNYHAPWTTAPGLVALGFVPVSILVRWTSLNPVIALQLFSLLGYICTAYALAFAYRTFCRTRGQAFWSFLIALSCVPVASLPGLLWLTRRYGLFSDSAGALKFMYTSDGFLHGLSTLPLLTYGTCAQVLSMALLARYFNSKEGRWLGWLAVVSLVSALIHPFEVFVTVAVAAVVLLREPGPIARSLGRVSVILAAAVAGLSPYVIQSLRVPWVKEVANANAHQASAMPAPLLETVGLPAILVVLLLLFGWPKSKSPNVVILQTWFICTLLVFYLPGIPFPPHMLDGFFFAVGLLLVIQGLELLAQNPGLSKPLVRFLVVPALVWTLLPHVIFRVRAWKDGNNTKSNDYPLSSAIAPTDEFATIEWLRKNASPNDLVLATEEAAPWMATAPIHSFASHPVFSLEMARFRDKPLRNSFYDGTLAPARAHEFLETLGVRFVVVPDGSPARLYLDEATLNVHFKNSAIYELPGQRMKLYHDSKIVEMGTSP